MRPDYSDNDDSTANQAALRQSPALSSTTDIHRIASYGELIQIPELNVQAADAVAYELESDAAFVAWIPEWLIDSKQLTPSDHHAQIIAGDIEAETEKAYLISTEVADSWLPKSQIRVFERADDASLTIPGVHKEVVRR